MSDSLWDTIKKAWDGDDEEAAPEMIPMPIPERPVVTRKEGESDLDYSLRKRSILFEWKKQVEDMELNPEKYMMEAPVESSESDDRRTVIQRAYDRSGEEID